MTGSIDQGQTYRYRNTVKDSSGVLANASSVVFTITLPDGTTATPVVFNSSTGVYDIAYATTQAGLHQLKAVATGGVLGTEIDVWTDAFTAEEPSRLLIGTDEALGHLRAQGVIEADADREQLRWLCSVATDVVEGDLGLALVRRTVTETFDGGGRYLDLSVKPPRFSAGGSVTVSSVTADGSAVTDYVVRRDRWRLARGNAISRIRWPLGYDNISVTYVSGCASPPEVARIVAMNTLQTMWQSSQQADHPFLDEVARRASLATLSTSVLPALSHTVQAAYKALKPGWAHAA